ncbi:Ig-like domain-containing protein [Streptomyces gamaensis]|uniref:Ig-like domain-containing protein n=1 Tax=Streptomyces gamaensis TaxID=1763542 RepID=A0ABW0Z0J2_9ACTN
MNTHTTHRTPVLPRVLAGLLCLLLPVLAACGGDNGGNKAKSSPQKEPRVTVSPADGAQDVRPGDPVTVKVEDGTLAEVAVVGGGKAWPGTLKDSTFTPEAPLATGTGFQVVVRTEGADGRTHEQHSTFHTLTPKQVNKVEVLPGKDTTVGVGQPVSLAFDHPVKDKAAVERRLKVTTDNNTEGSWGWVKEPLTERDRVDWRPKEYWKPGTKVTLEADLNGVDTGDGRYLVRSYNTAFTVGRSQIAKVDLDTHRLTFVQDGKTARTIPVTGGDAQNRTWSGKMTIMSKEGTIWMDSQTVGLGNAYGQWVQRSMRLTISGTYAHQAEWAESTIGRTNTSHGCLGMTTADATWFYDRAQAGDVFEVSGGKETVEAGNGFAEWNLSWEDWQARSALHRAAR